ncbi:MAG: hypothetical protein L3J43_05680 [Sulfurovum sp.]|nr:hypothetical protein [Sulfurovum sp.]
MKSKNFLYIIVYLFFSSIGNAQISNYNHFPTLQPSHILDEKLTNISFAFSMRVLESDYNGPLVRLRRAIDNAERDFSWGDNDIVDVAAIDIWRNGSNVFIHTWYDQSGLGRDAVQNTNSQQPRFYPDATMPYFQGDGSNDHLTVDTPNGIQDVTNAGNEGTVLTIISATTKNQHTFGVLTYSDRWSTHLNWSNNGLYFDPGICCNNPRSFANSANANNWAHYTFIKTSTHAIARADGIEKFNGTHTTGRCTRTEDFAIGWATGDQPSNHATSKFNEMIMYKTDIAITEYQDIEENAMTFWGL